ncbi:MAG: hemolysin family protein [Longimicrobiales bacterium]|nr:hemolysin family protein [Longimicrobiales bacterium]
MTDLGIVLAFTLGTSFLCSILEATLLSITRSYAESLNDQGDAAGRILKRFQERIDEPIAAILTLNTVANTAGATLSGALALEVFGNRWVAVFSGLLTLAILLFSEIVPKTLGATFWKTLARPAAYVLRAMVWVLKPVLIPLRLFSRLITPTGARPSDVSRAELEILAEIGRREGTLEEAEWKVVRNVMNLGAVTVAEVMTPRTDVVAVPADATVDEAKDIMLNQGHLRLPAFEESLDRIAGVVLARDLWQADREGAGKLRGVIRPISFMPGTKTVEEAIPEMRGQRNKMAIVVDEFGGTAGLVTLEDLLEEIVGEIQDEHEIAEPVDFLRLQSGGIRIWGGVPVREVNQWLDLGLPEEPHDTIAGLVFGRLNRIGRVGDEVEVEGGLFRVLRMRGRRIEYLVFEESQERREDVQLESESTTG